MNFWIKGKLLNYGWTFELNVNLWIASELLNYWWALKSWVSFWNKCRLLKYGWTFQLKVNCWNMGKTFVHLYFCLPTVWLSVYSSLLPWGRNQPFWWSQWQGFNSFEQSWNYSGRLVWMPTWRDVSIKLFRIGENYLWT